MIVDVAARPVPAPEETAELRLEVRSFLEERRAAGDFTPGCDSWISGHDPAFSAALGAKGWLGLSWPRRYGGQGRSNLHRYVVVEELLAAGAPVAAHWMAERQVGPSLLRHGSEALRERLLPAIARGECFFSIGLSEPDSGSDLASVRSRAERAEDGWRVRGRKIWTSHAHRSHLLLLLCRTSGEHGDHDGLTQLIVDLHAPGVSIHPITLMSGAQDFCEVVLDDVLVDDDHVLGTAGNGWQQVMEELAFERSGPERFLSTFPLLQAVVAALGEDPDPVSVERIGELFADLATLRRLSIGIATLLDDGVAPGAEAALVKDLGTAFERAVIDLARRALATRNPQVLGHYRDAVLAAPGFTLRGGTTEIMRGIVARGLGTR